MKASRNFFATRVLAALALCGAVTSVSAASIFLTPPVTVATESDQVLFAVWADFRDVPTIGGSFDLAFDPTRLEVLDFEFDPALPLVFDSGFTSTPAFLPDRVQNIGFGRHNGFSGVARVGAVTFRVLGNDGAMAWGTDGTGLGGPFVSLFDFGVIAVDYGTAVMVPDESGAPVLAVSPEAPDFGVLAAGNAQQLVISLSTRFDQSVELGVLGSDYALTAPFYVDDDPCSGTTLNAGETCELTLSYRPTEIAFNSGLLDIPGDQIQSSALVALLGRTSMPRIDVDEGLAVSAVVGSSAVLVVDVRNSGELPLTISGVAVSGFDSLILLDEECTVRPVPPGFACQVEILYQPMACCADFGTLRITSDDPVQHFLNRDIDMERIADNDLDGVGDNVDNCLLVANSAQRDTDADGYGNFCDADFNQDGAINFLDLEALKQNFFTSDPNTDIDGDGNVSFQDLALMKGMFFSTPGPSASFGKF